MNGTQQYECSICQDIGYVAKQVPWQHPDFAKLIECPCGLVRRRRFAYYDQEFGFTPAMAGLTLGDLKTIKGNEAGKRAAETYVSNPHGWLYLWGGSGDGKTLITAIIVNAVRASGHDAIWCFVPEMLDYLRNKIGEGASFEDEWNRIKNFRYLVLDDIASEQLTEWGRVKLFELIDWRYRLELPTIVTSNIHPDDTKMHFRLSSRFMDADLSQVVNCGDFDVRRIRR